MRVGRRSPPPHEMRQRDESIAAGRYRFSAAVEQGEIKGPGGGCKTHPYNGRAERLAIPRQQPATCQDIRSPRNRAALGLRFEMRPGRRCLQRLRGEGQKTGGAERDHGVARRHGSAADDGGESVAGAHDHRRARPQTGRLRRCRCHASNCIGGRARWWQQLGIQAQRRTRRRVPRFPARVEDTADDAGSVVIHQGHAGKLVDNVVVTGEYAPRTTHHVRLIFNQPRPFRGDRLSGERQPKHGLGTLQLHQGTIVAVEDGRSQWPAICVDETQAGGQPAHADRSDAGRIDAGYGEQLPDDRDAIPPPSGFSILLGPARLRMVYAVIQPRSATT